MSVTLLPPLFYTGLTLLQDSDENVILDRLVARDEALLAALNGLQVIREDLLGQFARLDDVENRISGLNNILNAIIGSFYLDIDQNGVVGDNYAFFIQLIDDLQQNINAINAVTGGIINFLGIKEQLLPVTEEIAKLNQLDTLIKTKLDYIYGKWDIDIADDILSA